MKHDAVDDGWGQPAPSQIAATIVPSHYVASCRHLGSCDKRATKQHQNVLLLEARCIGLRGRRRRPQCATWTICTVDPLRCCCPSSLLLACRRRCRRARFVYRRRRFWPTYWQYWCGLLQPQWQLQDGSFPSSRPGVAVVAAAAHLCLCTGSDRRHLHRPHLRAHL